MDSTTATATVPDLCDWCCGILTESDPLWAHLVYRTDGDGFALDVNLIHASCRPGYDAAKAAA